MDQKITVSLPSQRAKAMIVLIDEHPSMCEVVPLALEAEHAYRVYAFSRAEDALSLVRSVTPDVFLIDYHRSAMTGLELYKQLHASMRVKRRIPCILLNAPLLCCITIFSEY
jgi:response regulator RpfG family c-di-GMP phosphodiesterase